MNFSAIFRMTGMLCVCVFGFDLTYARMADERHFQEIGSGLFGTDFATLKLSTKLLPSLEIGKKVLADIKDMDLLEQHAALGRLGAVQK